MGDQSAIEAVKEDDERQWALRRKRLLMEEDAAFVGEALVALSLIHI